MPDRRHWWRGMIMLAGIAGPALFAVCSAPAAHPSFTCNTCHVSHTSEQIDEGIPLWNPELGDTNLANDYTSPTLDARLSSYDGASRLCLSCHDGSWEGIEAGSPAHIGSSSQTHPVSFIYDAALAQADGELRDPNQLPLGVLDAAGKMQCTSCHDVHATAHQADKSLRWTWFSDARSTAESRANTAFCRNCHIK